MKNHRIIIAATIVGLTVVALRAGAAISVTGGTRHVLIENGLPDNPAPIELDKPFEAGYLELQQSGVWLPNYPFQPFPFEYSASEWVSTGPIYIQTHLVSRPNNFLDCKAADWGNLNFTEDA